MEQLIGRDKTLSDLLIYLFAAYMAVPDKTFVEYVEKQKDKFDTGEDVTTKKLMQVPLIKKYKDCKRADKWQAPSVEEEEIIALTAQIGDLKKASANQTGTAENKGKKSAFSKKGEGKKNRASRFAKKLTWELVSPAAGKPTTKEMDKITYHFCMHHSNGAGLGSSTTPTSATGGTATRKRNPWTKGCRSLKFCKPSRTRPATRCPMRTNGE